MTAADLAGGEPAGSPANAVEESTMGTQETRTMRAGRLIAAAAALAVLVMAAGRSDGQTRPAGAAPTTMPTTGAARGGAAALPATRPAVRTVASPKPVPAPASAPGPRISEEEAEKIAKSLAQEQHGKPPEEREYMFAAKDMDYASFLNMFSRMSGLPIIGDPAGVKGKLTYLSPRKMTYREALREVRLILRNVGYWLNRERDHLVLDRIANLMHFVTPDRIYASLESFEAAGLEDDEFALLFYDLAKGSAAELVELYRGTLPDYVRLSAVGETNRIQIFATVADIHKFFDIIEIATKEGAKPVRELKTFVLKHVRAATVKGHLEQLVGAPRRRSVRIDPRTRRPVPTGGSAADQVNILVDDHANALHVYASPEKLEEVAKYLAILDKPETPVAFARVELQHIQASQAQQAVSPLVTRAAQKSPGQRFTVVADTAGNAVYLSGLPEDIDEARKIIEQVDVVREAGAEMHVVRLSNAQPSIVARALQTAFPPVKRGPAVGIQFIPDDANGILLVVALPNRWPEIDKAIKDYEEQLTAPGGPRAFLLTHGDAQQVAALLNQALAGVAKPRRGPALVTADPQTNQILVNTADEAVLEQADRLVKLLDVPPTMRPLAVIKLEEADAAQVAGLITKAFNPPGRKPVVQAVPEMASNSVLVRAPEGDIEEIRKFVAEIDAGPEGGEERRMFEIKHAKVQEVFNVLNVVYRPVAVPGKRRVVQDVKFAMTGTSIVAAGPKQKLDEVSELIKTLDRPDGDVEIRMYQFAGAEVATAAGSLQKLFHAQAQARPGRAVPVFVPDTISGTLMVSAPADLYEQIDSAIGELKDRPRVVSTIRRFALTSARAETVAPVIQQFLQVKAAELAATGAIPSGSKGSPPIVTVTPDSSGNRLIAMAPEPMMALVGEVVAEFDRGGDRDFVIRIVQLENSDPKEVAETVRAMMAGGGRSSAPRPVVRPSRSRGHVHAPPVPVPVRPQFGPESVSVVPSPGSKSLVLRGEPRDVEEVERWIKSIDEQAGLAKTMIKRIELRTADADEVAQTILNLLDETGAAKKSGDTGEFYWSGITTYKGKDIAISADSYASTLLISTTPAKFVEIDELLAMLDPPDEEPGEFGAGRGPFQIIELQEADPFDVVWNVEPLIEKLFGTKGPSLDYISFTKYILVYDAKPDEFKTIKQLVALFDKKREGPEFTIVHTSVPRPITAELVEYLRMLTGVDVEYEQPEVRQTKKRLITQIGPEGPITPPTTTPGARFVPPSTLTRLESQLASMPWAQATMPETKPTTVDAPAGEPTAASVPASGPTSEEAVAAEKATEPTSAEAGAGPARTFLEILERSTSRPAEKERAKVKITYDPATRTVRLYGRPDAVNAIADAMSRYFTQVVEGPVEPDIRVYQLRYIDVTVATAILQQMFNVRIVPQAPTRMMPAPTGYPPGYTPPYPGAPAYPGAPGYPGAPSYPGFPAPPGA